MTVTMEGVDVYSFQFNEIIQVKFRVYAELCFWTNCPVIYLK